MIDKNQKTWEELKNKLKQGQEVSGLVTQIESYGVFVDVGELFSALALVPFMGLKSRTELEDYPSIGTTVKGEILDFSYHKNIEYSYISIRLINS